MTTNQQRATNLLANSEFEGRTLHPAQARAIVHSLNDAGLLIPELPEPDKISIEVNHTGHPWMEWGDNQVSLVGNHIDVPRQFEMDADETRELAYYLLAAADHMEKNT